MASFSRRILRKDCEVFLIGSYSPQIVSNKLPSKRNMLKVLFFNFKEVKLKLQYGARLSIRETLLWRRHESQLKMKKNWTPKLKKPYDEWRDLKKYANEGQEEKSIRQLEKENKFVSELNDLFDISAENPDESRRY